MLELILALAVAAIGVFFLTSAFSNTSTGTKKTVVTAAKPQNQPKQQKKQQKQSKKDLAAQKKEDAEIERLIASQGASVTGMPTDKTKVVSLEETKTKKDAPKKASGNRAAPQVSTKQRILDQEAGFAYVEKKPKSSSPVAKDHGSDARDMDRELSKFFKQADKRGGKNAKEYGVKKDDNENKSSGKVTMKKKFTSDPTDLWAQGKTWE